MLLLKWFAIIIAILFCVKCSPSLPEEVCNYNRVVFSITDLLCEDDLLPVEVCEWIEVAELNIQILCSQDATYPEKEEAQKDLEEITIKLTEYINDRNNSRL